MFKKFKEREDHPLCMIVKETDTHDILWARTFTRMNVLVAVITAVVVICAVAFSLIAFTPLRTAIPGYPDSNSKREAIENAIRIDSLESVIFRWELYSENFRRIIAGEDPLSVDSIASLPTCRHDSLSGADVSKDADSLLRQIVAQEEKFGLSGEETRELPMEGLHFYAPLKGVVSGGFDRISHPFIDIAAPANSVVTSVLNGTVILSGWNDEDGYVVAVQHDGDILAIYKNNQKLLRKVGDKVSAGTPVALLGSSDSNAGEEHLRFELWHRGEPVDAAKFISF